MKKVTIEQAKALLKDKIMLNENGLANLKKTEQLKLYFNIMDQLPRLEEEQSYLDQVVIGEDATIFSPLEKYKNNALNLDHQSLLKVLGIATKIKETHNMDPTININELIEYSQAVKENMTKMRYMEGDRVERIIEELTIYKNPSNYTFFDFELFKKDITAESFKLSYMASHYFDYDEKHQQFTKKGKKMPPFASFSPETTAREISSYFAPSALAALNIYNYQQEETAPLKKLLQRTESND